MSPNRNFHSNSSNILKRHKAYKASQSSLKTCYLNRNSLINPPESEIDKSLLELKISQKMKNILFCSISHELRSPVNQVNGMLELIKHKVSDEEIMKYVQISLNSWKMLSSKINDILDYAMLESNSCILTNEPFSITDLLMEIEELIEYQYDSKRINFNIYVSEKIPKLIIHDAKRIKQILTNLIYNAIKFTEKGFVNVIVDCTFASIRRESILTKIRNKIIPSCLLNFAVSDSGLGIQKKKRLNLFKMFSEAQLNEAEDIHQSSKLMGIGLAFWQKMLVNMGSELEITSVPKYGSTFSFNLKMEYIKDSTSSPQMPRQVSVPNSGSLSFEWKKNLSPDRRKSPLRVRRMQTSLKLWDRTVSSFKNKLQRISSLSSKERKSLKSEFSL